MRLLYEVVGPSEEPTNQPPPDQSCISTSRISLPSVLGSFITTRSVHYPPTSHLYLADNFRQVLNCRHNGKSKIGPLPETRDATANRAWRSLSAASSTGKFSEKTTPYADQLLTQPICRGFFSRNYLMLTSVFAAGFAFEM